MSNIKAKIDKLESKLGSDITTKCPECGQVDANTLKEVQKLQDLKRDYRTLEMTFNPYTPQVEAAKMIENQYEERVSIEKTKANPFLSQKDTIICDIKKAEESLNSLKSQIDALSHRINSLEHLYNMSFSLRGELLKKSIKQIEEETNRYLESYFDSEIRVEFTLDTDDDLEVTIWKSGNLCSFKQLSKGQRSLLKLCFSVSLMKSASNRFGTHVSTLMFDEALDGQDTNLKLKAFRLFEELSLDHETVLVIDHSEELKSLFNKHYHVILNEDVSEIEEEPCTV